jgi:hypothetical protein
MGKTIMNIYGLQENLNSEVGGSSM